MAEGRVAVAMSGGVDSSVAAWLVKEAGYEAAGITLRLYENPDAACPMCEAEDAKKVADSMDMEHFTLDYRAAFNENVMCRFVDSYFKGETPNPCIECNKYIKFGKLCEEAKKMGFTHVATGHYAQIEYSEEKGRWLLKKGANEEKDQSYVLYNLTQEQLSMTLLPLGGLSKPEVREIAEAQGFVNAHKKDSQDICFVPDGDYSGFIKHFTGKMPEPGNFVDTSGKILGPHKGIINYTIGQRKGLGLALCKPMYVKSKDPETNEVVISEDGELFTKELDARDVNLIACDSFEGSVRLKARIRYKHREQWATVTMTGKTTAHVVFDEPVRAVAKGQSVVFYDGDIVFGGGVIS